MTAFLRSHKYLIVVILIYLASVWLINPFSEYAVNDDWDFITHVRNFRNGDFVKNSLIDSSFVLQGFIGVGWSYIFGLNYPALKILTVIFTILTLLGVDRILEGRRIRELQKFLGLLVFTFNPFVYPSSFTYMTEIYFLFFVVWSTYFLLRYVDSKNPRLLLYALLLSSLSMLVRQLGILLFAGIVFSSILVGYKSAKKLWRMYLFGLVIFAVACLAIFFWPQYNSDLETPVSVIFKPFANPLGMLVSLKDLFYTIPYVGLCTMVFSIPLFFKLRRRNKILVILLTLLLFSTFFVNDIFKIGNVFYPEGLLIKNNYLPRLSLYDNLIFKSILNMALLISFLSFVVSFAGKVKEVKKPQNMALLILAAFLVVPVIIHGNYFDRYLVNGLVILTIFCQILYFSGKNTSSDGKVLQSLLAVLVVLYIFSLSYEYHSYTSLEWKLARNLKETRVLDNRIFLSDTYTKYNSVFFKNNDPSISLAMPRGIEYKCYIQRDVEYNRSNLLFKAIDRVNSSAKINSLIKNPGVYGSLTSAGFRPPTKDSSKIVYKENYFSFQDWALGTQTFVVTYCE